MANEAKANTDLLPKWQSHKVVRAAAIISVTRDLIVLALPDGKSLGVAPADKMFARYMPVPGDYYVVYDDGYAAISPKKAFEDGYHAPNRSEDGAGPKTIGWAIKQMHNGAHVTRAGWNGKGMWLALQVADPSAFRDETSMTHPYVYIEYPAGHAAYPLGSRVPWLASQTDLLATDWAIAP